MRSSTALSILLFLAGTEALPQRSTHDSLLERNFKNVLSSEEKAALVKRSPQGPASNPGEFTNVGLSNVNPANFVPQMVDDGSVESSSTLSQSGTITSSSSLPPETPNSSAPNYYDIMTYDDSGPAFQSAFPASPPPVMPYSFGTGETPVAPLYPQPTAPHHKPTGHHHRPCATGASGSPCYPEPTGHHRHHNDTDRYNYGPEVGEEFIYTTTEVVGDVVTVHETLWQYNGTGWNQTDIHVPSGTITMALPPLPPSTASGAVGSGTGAPLLDINVGMEDVPIDNGFSGPGFLFGGPRPGFVGPKDEESNVELNEEMTIMKRKRGWLSGIF